MRFYEIMNKNTIKKEVEFNEQLIIYAFIITTHIIAHQTIQYVSIILFIMPILNYEIKIIMREPKNVS